MENLPQTMAFATHSCTAVLAALFALRSSAQALRIPLLAAIWIFGVHALLDVPDGAAIASVVCLFILVWLVHMTDLLWIQNASVPKDAAQPSWLLAYKMLFNARRTAKVGVATAEKEKERAPPGARDQEQRRAFRNKQTIDLLLLSGAAWLYLQAVPKLAAPILPEAIAAWQSHRSIRQYNAHQLFCDIVFRSFLVADFILGTYLVDRIFHALFALTFVCLFGWDRLDEWPPLWGSIAATTSVRSFWAHFWHRLVQRPFVDVAAYLLKAVGIPSRSAVGNMLVPFSVFLLSGIAHGVATWRLGFRCGWLEDVAWFGAQFAVITAEEVVLSGLRRAFGKRVPAWSGTAVGYIWTWSWMLWSIPKLQFAKIECGQR